MKNCINNESFKPHHKKATFIRLGFHFMVEGRGRQGLIWPKRGYDEKGEL